MREVIRIEDGVCKMERWRMAEPVNFTLLEGEQIAVVGANGAGKSMFVDMIAGRHPIYPDTVRYDFTPSTKEYIADNINYITFRDTYGGDNDRTYFLQQRWNQMEIDKETPTAGSKLEEAFLMTGEDNAQRRAMQDKIYQLLQLDKILDKYIILLSSGELRKLKLASALFAEPRVMIIDNPFIGLDADTRLQLRDLLATLIQPSTDKNTPTPQLILVLSKTDDIPDFITHIVEVKDMKVMPKTTRVHYIYNIEPQPSVVISQEHREKILHLPKSDRDYHAQEVIRMNKVSIRYGERTILKELDWTVKNGERWAVSGQNGAGKSTLLSLVCADNPQSYACDITLFDKPRGSGETIWDIKKHIGYVSPEMHRSYHRDIPTIRVVASGLKDSIGMYVKVSDEELETCRFWMDIFGIKDKENQSFMELSSGEQRLALLARAFVKDPELLILDEPLHGLDDNNRQLVRDVIETFCQRQNKTLIMVSHYKEELPPCINKHLQLIRH